MRILEGPPDDGTEFFVDLVRGNVDGQRGALRFSTAPRVRRFACGFENPCAEGMDHTNVLRQGNTYGRQNDLTSGECPAGEGLDAASATGVEFKLRLILNAECMSMHG